MRIKVCVKGSKYTTFGTNCIGEAVYGLLQKTLLIIVKGEDVVILDSVDFIEDDLEKIRTLGVKIMSINDNPDKRTTFEPDNEPDNHRNGVRIRD